MVQALSGDLIAGRVGLTTPAAKASEAASSATKEGSMASRARCFAFLGIRGTMVRVLSRAKRRRRSTKEPS